MIAWIKRNKFSLFLFLVIIYLVVKQSSGVRPLSQPAMLSIGGAREGSVALKSAPLVSELFPSRESAPTTQTNRLVVQESNLSLVVKNVRESSDKAVEYAKSVGGYMVSSSLSQPEEAPYAYIVLRVPAKDLRPAIEYFRSLAIKVSSENLLGTDVTDEYTDIAARLDTLNKTKAKFEEILAKAEKVPDIMEVQRQLISLQDQIDSLKGRQKYLEKTAELAKISLNLSTDEFSLPYAPAGAFRPAVIFKQAVRSLVGTLRWLAKVAIWLGVYSVVIIPVGVVVFYLRKKLKRSSRSS
ncbi:MAG: DUF4349 domain-containing protein [Microgenomates group bacterium]